MVNYNLLKKVCDCFDHCFYMLLAKHNIAEKDAFGMRWSALVNLSGFFLDKIIKDNDYNAEQAKELLKYFMKNIETTINAQKGVGGQH